MGKYQGCDWRETHGERAPESQQLAVLEMDGLWTRTAAGATELQVIRDAAGAALGAFGSWEAVIDQAWQQGAVDPTHLVSDGDPAIAAGLRRVACGQRRVWRRPCIGRRGS